jgi:mono/diheme cytochrome c family protein
MARPARPRRSWKQILLWAIGIAVVVFVLIQFVPYGRSSHSNPSATNPFPWTDPQAKAIAKRSCYDCHSNQTDWWWATNIAPFSWLVQHDVDDGRARLNFSEFDGLPPASRFQQVMDEGEMPPFQYTIMHPGGKLTEAEKKTLIDGYAAGLAAGGGSNGGQTQSSPTPAATGSSADGAALVQSRCSTCHGAPTTYRAGSAAEAQALIDTMIQQGAQVSPAEEQALIQYFTQ